MEDSHPGVELKLRVSQDKCNTRQKKTRTKNKSISNSNQFLVQRSKNKLSTKRDVLQKLVFGYTAQLTGNLDHHKFAASDYKIHVKNFMVSMTTNSLHGLHSQI